MVGCGYSYELDFFTLRLLPLRFTTFTPSRSRLTGSITYHALVALAHLCTRTRVCLRVCVLFGFFIAPFLRCFSRSFCVRCALSLRLRSVWFAVSFAFPFMHTYRVLCASFIWTLFSFAAPSRTHLRVCRWRSFSFMDLCVCFCRTRSVFACARHERYQLRYVCSFPCLLFPTRSFSFSLVLRVFAARLVCFCVSALRVYVAERAAL